MSFSVEAIYENGMLKLAQPLPLKEHEKVRVTIEQEIGWTERTAGMLGWKGDHETLERILTEAEELEDFPMTFVDLVVGASVFLDANPLVYHFSPDPLLGPACTALIRRIENRELKAFTSTHVLSEASHHLMTLEASSAFGWTSKVVQHLKQQPAKIQQLGIFRQAVERVPQLGIQTLTIPQSLIAQAAAISQQHGLLSNDALPVAVMQANGLTNLASHDSDFDRVQGIARFAPP